MERPCFAKGTCLATRSLLLIAREGFGGQNRRGSGLFQFESTWWWFATALALLELAAVVLMVYLGKLRRRRWVTNSAFAPGGSVLPRNPKLVSSEVERLCSEQSSTEPLIKQMTAEDRVLFEVSVIEALNKRSRESQHRLRSALIKYGYDEQCARRVMSEDLSDRVRATALLALLRPQGRDDPGDFESRSNGESSFRAVRASQVTGPQEAD